MVEKEEKTIDFIKLEEEGIKEYWERENEKETKKNWFLLGIIMALKCLQENK